LKITKLACRLYRVEPNLEKNIKKLLLRSKIKEPILYDVYQTPNLKIELFIELRERHKNEYGHEVVFWADQIMELLDREKKKKVERYYLEYKIQIFENVDHFKNHVLIFGPKHVDSKLKKAMINYLKQDNDTKILDPLTLIKVDFEEIDKLSKEFPNIQHFCVRNVPDERIKGVIVRGNMLEETDQYERFIKEDETKGPINFLGITTDYGKLLYIGKDGSIYSRMSFAKVDTIKIIYNLFIRFKKIGVLSKRIEDF
jgi:hypothetical protein